MSMQLPHGVQITAMTVGQFKANGGSGAALRAVREGGHVVVYNGRVGHVSPVLYVTASVPVEISALVPQLMAEIAETKHSEASNRARERGGWREALAARGLTRKADRSAS